jgi:hypothetical protein
MVKASELKECSYFLVRYVPDVVKGEFINIGVFLFCPAEQFLDCLFSDDFRRLSRFHAQADTRFLQELQPYLSFYVRGGFAHPYYPALDWGSTFVGDDFDDLARR